MKHKKSYNTEQIEKKWKDRWLLDKIYKTEIDNSKPKYYCLDTWPYPSADGVHIGYVKSFGGMDIQARYKRMKGFNVLYPMGWDTFGLPAENYAIKSGRHPREITQESIGHFKEQFQAFGLSYDWDRELDTANPRYYKWTQWLFLTMFNNGLAYKKNSPVNWCPSCKTVLAKEQVLDDNTCEQCESIIEQRDMDQWYFKVTEYAERLADDIGKLDWEEKYKNAHAAWIGKKIEDGKITFRIHDWCISRQRYWGPPIPIIYCDDCGIVGVPEKDLPVVLPYSVDFTPTGEAPLAKDKAFVNTTCPTCGKPARREVDTLDTFVSSAWYEFRYLDPYNKDRFISQEAINYWENVDHYQGSIEHLTAHLIYARFVTKVLHTLGLLPFEEPFPKYSPVGILVDKSGQKFSKRLGNAPSTNALLEQYGGDLLRLSCQFINPFGEVSRWGEQDIIGVKKFFDKVWQIFTVKVDGNEYRMPEDITREMHILIKEVEAGINEMKYNVALSKMIVFIKKLSQYKESVDISLWKDFTLLLAPFTPFLAEEMWHEMGEHESIHKENWPIYNETAMQKEYITIAVQVDGKMRDTIEIRKGENEQSIIEKVLATEKISKYITSTYKIIYIQNKIINFINTKSS